TAFDDGDAALAGETAGDGVTGRAVADDDEVEVFGHRSPRARGLSATLSIVAARWSYWSASAITGGECVDLARREAQLREDLAGVLAEPRRGVAPLPGRAQHAGGRARVAHLALVARHR